MSSCTWTGNTVTSSVSVHPASLAKHPQRWNKEEVRVWLHWCTEEFSIDMVPPEKFDMNGKALCLLARSDFMERLPNNGDVLYNCLQNLISKNTGGGMFSQQTLATPPGIIGSPLSPANKPSTLSTDAFKTGLLLVPSTSVQFSQSPPTGNQVSKLAAPGTQVSLRPFIPIQPRLGQSTVSSLAVNQGQSRASPNLSLKVVERMSLDDDSVESDIGSPGLGLSRVPSPGKPVVKTEPCSSLGPNASKSNVLSLGANRSTECRLLWEFIHQLLLDTKYIKYVCWENREDYVFRIANPTGLAELWGQQKNRTNMTYEKLSRALRYYYRMNIIRKVPGKRLTYKFLQPPSMIQKGQRGAKPHSKIHLPANVQSPANEDGIKYDEESDLDSTPSDMDSPQHSENIGLQSDIDKGNEYKHYTDKTMLDNKLTSDTLSSMNMNFPYPIPSARYSSSLGGGSYGPQSRLSGFDSRHLDVPYLNLNMSSEYYAGYQRDRLNDKIHDWMANKANTEFHPENVIRPKQSYPAIGGTWGSYDSLKQESSPERTENKYFNDYPSVRTNRVLRLPIDTLFRSQSCELPFKNNGLTVLQVGQRPGHARSVSPRPDNYRSVSPLASARSVNSGDSEVFQSEPEDLSMKKGDGNKPYDRSLDHGMNSSATSDDDNVEIEPLL